MENHEPLEDTPFNRLCAATVELLVTVGMIGSISGHWPLMVQENWEARIENLIQTMLRESDEVREFAEAFDEEEDE